MTLLLRGCASDAVAIMARAESLTVEGACPSAELIEPSAVALLAAVRDHFQQPHCRTSKTKAPLSGAEGDARSGSCLGSDRPDTLGPDRR